MTGSGSTPRMKAYYDIIDNISSHLEVLDDVLGLALRLAVLLRLPWVGEWNRRSTFTISYLPRPRGVDPAPGPGRRQVGHTGAVTQHLQSEGWNERSTFTILSPLTAAWTPAMAASWSASIVEDTSWPRDSTLTSSGLSGTSDFFSSS